MRRFFIVCATIVVASPIVPAHAQPASEPGPESGRPPAVGRERGFRLPDAALLRAARVRPGTGRCAGLFEFTDHEPGQGPKLCTHGPDAYEVGDGPRDAGATAAAGGGTTLFTQANTIPCTGSGPFVHVFYIYEGANRLDAPNPNAMGPYIKEAVAIANKIVERSAKQKKAQRQVRWKMTSGCKLKITAAKMDTSYSPGTIRATLLNRGKVAARDKVLAFVDQGACWGLGTVYIDDRSGSTNQNNRYGSASRVQLGCIGESSLVLGEVAAHEMFHTFGAVQDSAPRATGAGHCFDESDVMCYADGPSVRLKRVCAVTTPELLDCGKNDYFNPKPKSGSYLARKWNTARIDHLRRTIATKKEKLPRPTVAFDGLTPGQTVAGVLQLEATATAPAGATISKVRFLVNGTLVHTDSSAPFRASIDTRWDGAVGYRNGTTVKVSAEAVDSYQRTATSPSVGVTVGNPTVRLTAPNVGPVADGTIQWAADAGAGPGRTVAKVELFVDGSLVATDVSAPYGGTVNVAGLWGPSLRARVTDSEGAVRWTPHRYVEPMAPEIEMLGWYRGSTGGPVTVAAEAFSPAGAAIAQVTFRANGTLVGTDTTAPYTATWTPSAGSYTLTATVTDAAGGTAMASSDLEVWSSSASVAITAPTSGATVSGSTSVTAVPSNAGTVSSVEFYVDGEYVRSDTTAPYSMSWNTTTVGDGTHLIVAEVWGDEIGVSQGTAVVVDNGSGATIDTPNTLSGTVTFPATVTVPPGKTVEQVTFYAGSDYLGVDGSAPYQRQLDTTGFPDGSVLLRAMAQYSDWSEAWARKIVTMANTKVTVTAPTNGSTVSGDTVVTATAKTDSEAIVEWVRFYVDGVSIGRDGTAPFRRTWKTGSWGPGTYTVTATLQTTDGRVLTSPARTVTVT